VNATFTAHRRRSRCDGGRRGGAVSPHAVPLGGGRAPPDGDRAPTDGVCAPRDGDRAPSNGVCVTRAGDGAPADGERVPPAGGGVIEDGHAVTVARHSVTVQRDAVPVSRRALPVSRCAVPVRRCALPVARHTNAVREHADTVRDHTDEVRIHTADVRKRTAAVRPDAVILIGSGRRCEASAVSPENALDVKSAARHAGSLTWRRPFPRLKAGLEISSRLRRHGLPVVAQESALRNDKNILTNDKRGPTFEGYGSSDTSQT